MKFKAFIFTFLSSFSLYSSENELVIMLDRVTEAQNYWKSATHTSRFKFWKHSLENIFNVTYTKQVSERAQILEKKHLELLVLLGDLSQNKTDQKKIEAAQVAIKKCTTLLNNIEISPSHFEKNWFSYTAAVVGLGCAATALCTTEAGPATANLINEYAVQPTKMLYTYIKGIAHPVNNQEILDAGLTDCLQKAAQTEQTADFMHAELRNFPIESLSFKEKEELFTRLHMHVSTIAPREIQVACESLGNAFANQYQEQFHPAHRTAEETSAPTQRSWGAIGSAAQGIKSWIVRPVKKALVEACSPECLETVSQLSAVGRDQCEKNGALLALGVQIGLLKIQQRDLQVGEILTLTKGILAAVPLALASYATYKGATSLYNYLTDSSAAMIKIKKDLITLELELNKQRTATVISDEQRGLCIYLTHRLENGSQHVSDQEKESYLGFVKELRTDSLTADQKITIIECMFKSFSFLNA